MKRVAGMRHKCTHPRTFESRARACLIFRGGESFASDSDPAKRRQIKLPPTLLIPFMGGFVRDDSNSWIFWVKTGRTEARLTPDVYLDPSALILRHRQSWFILAKLSKQMSGARTGRINRQASRLVGFKVASCFCH